MYQVRRYKVLSPSSSQDGDSQTGLSATSTLRPEDSVSNIARLNPTTNPQTRENLIAPRVDRSTVEAYTLPRLFRDYHARGTYRYYQPRRADDAEYDVEERSSDEYDAPLYDDDEFSDIHPVTYRSARILPGPTQDLVRVRTNTIQQNYEHPDDDQDWEYARSDSATNDDRLPIEPRWKAVQLEIAGRKAQRSGRSIRDCLPVQSSLRRGLEFGMQKETTRRNARPQRSSRVLYSSSRPAERPGRSERRVRDL